MKVRLGDFYPRVEWGWPPPGSPRADARRCHKLGAHSIELMGGLGLAEVAARNRDTNGVISGLDRVDTAARELAEGLPEAKPFVHRLRRRARELKDLIQPYGYRDPLTRRAANAVEEQVRAMAPYELEVEGLSIKACGGHATGAHAWGQEERKKATKALPELPKEFLREAKAKKTKRIKEIAVHMKRLMRQTAPSKRKKGRR